MNINRIVAGCGSIAAMSLVVGASLYIQPAMAQETIHSQPSTGAASEVQKPVDTVAVEIALRQKLELEPLPVPEQSDYYLYEEDLDAHLSVPNGPGRLFGEAILDENPYPAKPVKVNFLPPANVKQVRGWVKVMIESHERRMPDQFLKVKDNSITMNLPDDAEFRLDISCLPGVYLYMPSLGPEDWHGINWTDGKGIRLVTHTDGIRQVDVPLEPAGAIAYQVKLEDGTPVKINEFFMLDTYLKSLGIEDEARRSDWVGKSYGPRQQVLISKLPIGKPFVVYARQEVIPRYVRTTALLTPDNPVQEITGVIPVGQAATVTVLDDKGKPLSGIHGWARFSNASKDRADEVSVMTDAQGQIIQTHVALAPGETLFISIAPGTGWQRDSIQLDMEHLQASMQLKPGLHLKGKLVHDATDKPIAKEIVYAVYYDSKSKAVGLTSYAESVVTDENGEFEFTGLSPREYQVRAFMLEMTHTDFDMRQPPTEPLVVRVKRAEGKHVLEWPNRRP